MKETTLPWIHGTLLEGDKDLGDYIGEGPARYVFRCSSAKTTLVVKVPKWTAFANEARRGHLKRVFEDQFGHEDPNVWEHSQYVHEFLPRLEELLLDESLSRDKRDFARECFAKILPSLDDSRGYAKLYQSVIDDIGGTLSRSIATRGVYEFSEDGREGIPGPELHDTYRKKRVLLDTLLRRMGYHTPEVIDPANILVQRSLNVRGKPVLTPVLVDYKRIFLAHA